MSTVERQELKQAVKDALKEVMLENSEMLKDILVEVLEDLALLRQMEEGRQTEFINRSEVIDHLESKR